MTITAILIIAGVGVGSFTLLNSNQPTNVQISGLQDPWTIEDVARNSEFIVQGTVKDLIVSVDENSEIFGDKPMVFTDAVIAIDEEYTGKYSQKEITVRTLGGEIEEFRAGSSLHPTFELGTKVVLFVTYEPESEMGDHYFVAGHKLGKYELRDGKAFGHDYLEGMETTKFFSDLTKMRTR